MLVAFMKTGMRVAMWLGTSLTLFAGGACERKRESANPADFASLPAPSGCTVEVPSLEALLPPLKTAAPGNAGDGSSGLQLATLPAQHAFYQAGLRAGDVLTKINGLDLSSPVNALAAFKSIQQRGVLTAAYVRGTEAGVATCAVTFVP